jgi:HEAT repeat protein
MTKRNLLSILFAVCIASLSAVAADSPAPEKDSKPGPSIDAAAVGKLIEQTGASAEPERKAAWHSLAQVPTTQAVPAFTSAVADKNDALATAELLDYAETLAKAGKLREADKLAKLRKKAGPLDAKDRCKLLRIHGHLGTPESISLVLAALNDKDPEVYKAALEAAAILPSTDFTGEITQRMNDAKGQAKIDLLDVLGKRGNQIDDRTVMRMYLAMLDKDEKVVLAAIRATKNAGITSTATTLVNFTRTRSGPVGDAAEDALIHIPGDAVTKEIVRDLTNTGTEPARKMRLLRILGQRPDKSASEAVSRAAGDANVQVRTAAYEALGSLGKDDAFDTLLAAFDREPGPDRDAAEKAMLKLNSDIVTTKLLSSYFDVGDIAKPSMLRVLAPRRMEAIDALLSSEVGNKNQGIREAAVSGLIQRANPTTSAALLEAAKAGPPKLTEAALNGCLEMAKKLESRDKEAAGKLYAEVAKLATNEQQKQTAADRMKQLGDSAK